MVCVGSLCQDAAAVLSNGGARHRCKLGKLFSVVNANVGDKVRFGHAWGSPAWGAQALYEVQPQTTNPLALFRCTTYHWLSEP